MNEIFDFTASVRRFQSLSGIIVAFLIAAILTPCASAEESPLTVDQVCTLLKAGIEPEDIKAQLAKRGVAGKVDAADVKKLTASGGDVDFALYLMNLSQDEGKQVPAQNLDGNDLEAGETFTNSIGMKMIWVKPGNVQGRAWEWKAVKYQDAGVRMVQVNAGYYLCSTETTQSQWAAVMGNNPSRFRGNTHPVEQVSWNDAVAFCQRLNERERQAGKLPKGFVYALPSEAQWEYACRAGTTGDYAGTLDAMAWYDKTAGESTMAVATKQANAWGFHDMHGNVWEWCSDAVEGGRANRGGGWFSHAEYCRSGRRSAYEPAIRFNYLGFRPALVPSK